MEDYMEALTGGPWVVMDAYLNVARWRPEFCPKNEKIESVVAWVRLPDLLRPVRQEIFVEFRVANQTLSIVYESLGLLCNKCGWFGHNKASCTEFHKKKAEVEMEVESAEANQSNGQCNDGDKDLWKTVQRVRRQRRAPLPWQNHQNGSRFSVLDVDPGGEGTSLGVDKGHVSVGQGVGDEKVQREEHQRLRQRKGPQDTRREANRGSEVRALMIGSVRDGRKKRESGEGEDRGGGKVLIEPVETSMEEGVLAPRVTDARGAASKSFATVLRDMRRRYRLDIVVILEPRISGALANKVIKNWGFKHSEINDPWLLAGDFNDIKTPMEQKGGGRISEVRCRRFNNWIQDSCLIDLEAHGPFYTWKGPKWEGLERVFKRLDRCLCNMLWQEKFVNAEVKVVPRVCSDHHPLVVCLEASNICYRHKPFRYEAAWQMHELSSMEQGYLW
ncbi:hypothetical protein K1719_041922 [Acacia pycnantha]|nr:hypothetical protein K1719_041922 [Acacia pycnantha]